MLIEPADFFNDYFFRFDIYCLSFDIWRENWMRQKIKLFFKLKSIAYIRWFNRSNGKHSNSLDINGWNGDSANSFWLLLNQAKTPHKWHLVHVNTKLFTSNAIESNRMQFLSLFFYRFSHYTIVLRCVCAYWIATSG